MLCLKYARLTLAVVSLCSVLSGCKGPSVNEVIGQCIKPPPTGQMKISKEQAAKIKADLAAIPNVGKTEAEVSGSFKGQAELEFRDLTDDETVLYMLLSAIECFKKSDVITEATAEQLTKDVFAKYLSEVGQASADTTHITEAIAGRLERALGSGGLKDVLNWLNQGGIKE